MRDDLAGKLEAVRDRYTVPQPDKPDTPWAVMTEAAAQLRATPAQDAGERKRRAEALSELAAADAELLWPDAGGSAPADEARELVALLDDLLVSRAMQADRNYENTRISSAERELNTATVALPYRLGERIKQALSPPRAPDTGGREAAITAAMPIIAALDPFTDTVRDVAADVVDAVLAALSPAEPARAATAEDGAWCRSSRPARWRRPGTWAFPSERTLGGPGSG